MNFKSITVSKSLRLPELKSHQKFLITEPDDIGFAQEQADKINQDIYLRNQLKLKPWQKDSYKNVYSSLCKTNHQILQDLKLRSNSTKTMNINNSSRKYYHNDELQSIKESQEISKQIISSSEIRYKYKQPLTNVKTYTNETRQSCKKNMLYELIQIERGKLKIKINEYNKSLKQEIKNLNKDIEIFDKFASNEIIVRNRRIMDYIKIETHMKNLMEATKKLSQEYHVSKAEIQRILKKINDLKIYVTFVHKLFGGKSELENCDLDDIDFPTLNDKEIHSLIKMLYNEIEKHKSEENILKLQTSDEELLANINKIDIIFKVQEENIMKTLELKEKLRKEEIELKENREKEKEYQMKIIEEREKEYKKFYEEYLTEKNNLDKFKHSSEELDIYMRKLHIDLFEFIKDVNISNKHDIDEYNIIDKIIKLNLKEIKNKERKIDKLMLEMEKYSQEDNKKFMNIVIKVKNENKILKYFEEKKNKELAESLKNEKILDKINKIMITGRNKYKMPVPLSILKKRKDEKKEIKTEPSYLDLLHY